VGVGVTEGVRVSARKRHADDACEMVGAFGGFFFVCVYVYRESSSSQCNNHVLGERGGQLPAWESTACCQWGATPTAAVAAAAAAGGVQVEQQMRTNQGMGQEDDVEIARLEHENTQLR
jgi:hypothetical protein